MKCRWYFAAAVKLSQLNRNGTRLDAVELKVICFCTSPAEGLPCSSRLSSGDCRAYACWAVWVYQSEWGRKQKGEAKAREGKWRVWRGGRGRWAASGFGSWSQSSHAFFLSASLSDWTRDQRSQLPSPASVDVLSLSPHHRSLICFQNRYKVSFLRLETRTLMFHYWNNVCCWSVEKIDDETKPGAQFSPSFTSFFRQYLTECSFIWFILLVWVYPSRFICFTFYVGVMAVPSSYLLHFFGLWFWIFIILSRFSSNCNSI